MAKQRISAEDSIEQALVNSIPVKVILWLAALAKQSETAAAIVKGGKLEYLSWNFTGEAGDEGVRYIHSAKSGITIYWSITKRNKIKAALKSDTEPVYPIGTTEGLEFFVKIEKEIYEVIERLEKIVYEEMNVKMVATQFKKERGQ